MPDSDGELWCEGRALERRARIPEDEAAALRARLAASRRRLAWSRRLGWAGVGIAAGGVAAAFAASSLPEVEYSGLPALAVAAALWGPAGLGALQEIVSGESRASRLAFAALSAAIAAGVPASRRWGSSGVVGAALAVAWLGLLLGGWAALLLRWLAARRLAPALALGAEDAQRGETLRFSGGLEILPRSRLACRIEGAPAKEWRVCYVASLTPAPKSFLEAPWQGPTPAARDGSVYLQRHLTEDEARELRGLAARWIKRSVASLVVTTYLSAVAVRLMENIVFHRLDAPLTARGWCVAAAVGAGLCLRRLLLWRRIRADEPRGQVVVVRERDAPPEGPAAAEFLPTSGLLWSSKGTPAPWRIARW